MSRRLDGAVWVRLSTRVRVTDEGLRSVESPMTPGEGESLCNSENH